MDSKAIVITGMQWGDEGKGKIVDYCAEKADVVVRYQGGNNAGHTVVANGQKFKFHILPSGAPQQKECVIGNGCVVNPKVLLEEMNMLREGGIEPNLWVSSTAHVVMPYHLLLDGLEEAHKGKFQAGTTRQGIGPAYSDKAARFGIRMWDLLDKEILAEKVAKVLPLKQYMLSALGFEDPLDLDALVAEYWEYGQQLKPYITDTAALVNQALDEGKTILLEGAQGTLLGIDEGMYPYGTSSNASALGVPAGAGISPTRISSVLGVLKAYTSRVGGGPLPTEILDAVGSQIREQGHEYGTTTGRPRRIGWLDTVAARYARMLNHPDGLVVTLLDVLSDIPTLKICTAYEVDGEQVDRWPIQAEILARVTPVYVELPGWTGCTPEEWLEIAHQQSIEALPREMQGYLSEIEHLIGTPIFAASVGPEREATILIQDVF